VSGLRVALVGGPMYDRLYDLLPDDIEILVHADHPTLNREVAALLGGGERIDVLATHGKYAPSQSDWLLPLDDLVSADVLCELAPRAVDLCRFDGALLCIPRCIDVRVLWWRTDLLEGPPRTWTDVEAAPGAFGFTGRESGLFGLFFELVVGAGGSLFDDGLRPTLATPAGIAAVERLQRLAVQAPEDLPTWHYDDVDDALLGGRVAMAAAWPGGTNRIRRSELAGRLAPARYPGGWSYSGCHGWAIPRSCGDVPAAVALIEQLAGAAAGATDAASGTVPANRVALEAHDPVDDVDAERLAITAATIGDGMLSYPPLRRFPDVEDAGWGAIHDALRGERSAAEAVAAMQAAAEEALS
jgi:multiple sugar transport system substrate-binding protein